MKLPWDLPLLLDGAVGTQLLAAGMPESACPEQWILEHSEVVFQLQRRYMLAGSDVLYTPTFGANRARLSEYGLSDKTAEINIKLAGITRSAAETSKKPVLVAGCISPTGLIPEPFGSANFSVIEEIYREQATALKDAGVDLIVCETMTSLTEARAALLAARETGLPVIVTLTVDKKGSTLSGSRLLPAVATLQSLGAAAVGLNCSEGVSGMAKQLKEALPHAAVPLVAKPSAAWRNGNLSPAGFAEQMKKLLDAGAAIVGGCCGTAPEHIAVLRGVLDTHPIVAPREINTNLSAVESEAFVLSDDIELSPPIPCDSSLAERLIEAEETANTALVHIGYDGDIEYLIQYGGMSRIPIALNTNSAILLDEALHRFPGRLIVDSLSEIEKPLLEEIAFKYGAVVF